MSGQADGAIVVDTDINTEGFNQGSEALKQAMNRLQKRFDSVAKQLENSVAQYAKALGSGNAKNIQRFSDKLDKAKDAAGRFRDELSQYGEEYQTLVTNINKTQEALERLQDRQAKLDATGVKENSKAYQSLLYDIKRVQTTLDEYKAELNKTLGAKDGVDVTLANPGQLQELTATIERIKEQFSELQNDEGVASLVSDIEKATLSVEQYQAKVDKMSALGATDRQWQSIYYDINKAAESAEALSEELDTLNQYGGIDETQYESLSQRLQDAMEGFNALTSAADETEKETRRIPPVVRGIGTAFSIPLHAFGALASSAGRLGATLANITGAGFLSFMRAFASSADEAAKSLAKMSASAVSGGIKRLGAWLSNAARSMLLFGRQTKRSNGVLKKSFATILKYGLGVRSFYYLFRKIRQAIKEGFENLARYSDTLNTSISDVISSFKRFENQFAASFAPLVNAIAPAISQLIDGLTEATYRAGQFIAALSGQKTVIRAKEVQEDFAASLEETKKAAKAAKNQLAGFDKLEILKEPDDKGTNPEDMFETVPVEGEAKKFADDFKNAWVNVDLSGIGKIIGDKIKVALDNIPWPDIRQGAENMGKRLATFLNGIINVPDLGTSIGKTIAEAINTAFSFLDGFVWKFNWKGLGASIMDMIEAACDNLDWRLINHALQGLAIGVADLLNAIFSRVEVWEKVGRTLGKALNAVVNAGITFLEKFDFKQAARAIVAGLNAAILGIEWDNVGRFFGDLFGGALQFLYTAVTEFDWVKLGESLAESANECTAVLLEKIKDFDWSKIGTAIADGLNAYVSGIEWDKQGELFGKLIGGALTAAASFIRGLNYGEIVQAIQDFFSNAIQQIDFYDLLTVWGVAALVLALKKIVFAHPLLAILVGAVFALGPELGNAIDKMISDIPWAEVAQNISQFRKRRLWRRIDAKNPWLKVSRGTNSE